MGGKALGKEITIYEVMPDHPRIKVVGVDTDHKEGDHVLWDRRNYLPLRDSTIASYMAAGVVLPAVIRKDEASDDLFVVDGRRRFLHAREANRRLKESGSKLRVKIRVQIDSRDLNMAAFLKSTLNEVREQNDPIARALDAAGDAQRFGVESVATSYGVSQKQVKNWIKLLDLCKELQLALAAGEVTQKFALEQVGTPIAEQRAKLERMKAVLSGKKKGTRRGAAAKPREATRLTQVKRSLTLIESGLQLDVDWNLTDREKLLLRWVVGREPDEAVRGILPLGKVAKA